MKKINPVSGAIVCLVLSFSAFAQNANRAPSGCGSDVPLNLFVNSGGSISPDAQGPSYSNGGTKRGQISVIFQISNCSYDFIVQLNNSTRYLVTSIPGQGTFNAKFANFDRIASVPITSDANVMNDFCGTTTSGGYKYDNYAGCSTDSSGGRYVRRSVGFDLGDNTHNLRFQYSSIDNPTGNPNVAGTAYIKVYHPDNNTWNLVPESLSENGIGEIGVFMTNGTPTSNPPVPFWFTVRR